MSICDWCTRSFEKRHAPNNYSLLLAGISVCYVCADLWEQEMVRLHNEKLHVHEKDGKLCTDTGCELPLSIASQWKPTRIRSHLKALATDSYGKSWVADRVQDLVTLRPVGR